MMKKLALALVFILCLVGGAAWYALSNAGALIARFKPQIEAAASKAAGAPVTFGELETSILPDTRVVIDAVSVGGANGLSLRDLALHLNVWALLGKRLEITELSLSEPTLTFVKDADGVSLEGLPKRSATGAPSSTTPPSQPSSGSNDAAAPPLAIKLEKFVLRKATIVWRDRVAKTERRIAPLDIEASLDIDGAVVRLPQLTLAALVDSKLNLGVSASDLVFDQATTTLTAPDIRADIGGFPIAIKANFNTTKGTGDVALRSAGLDLAKIAALGELIPPAVRALGLSGSIAPDIKAVLAPTNAVLNGTVTLREVALQSGGFAITKMNGDLALRSSTTEQTIETKNLALHLNAEPVTGAINANVKGTVATLQTMDLATVGGKIKASGSLDQKTQALQIKLDLANLDVGRILGVLKPGAPNPLSGKLTRFQTAATGKMGPTLLETLTGSGSLLVNDGKLAGENLGGKVLKAATSFPFISGSLFETLPPETKRALEAKETVISALSSSFSIGGGGLATKDLALKSPLFDIAAGGRASFAGALDLGATISFEKGLSSALAGKVKEIKVALDKEGRLAVPLTIKGTAPNLSVAPDFSKLLSGNVGKVLEQKAGEALGKLLGDKKGGKGVGGLLGF